MKDIELPLVRRLALLGLCVVIGLIVWFSGPPDGLLEFVPEQKTKAGDLLAPEAVASKAWTILAIFAGVIASLMLRPYHMGPMVLLGITLIISTRAAHYNDAMAGYGKAVTWLVVAAFMIAAALVKTGLGRRVALWLVALLGRTTLGLAYALSAADLLLAPIVPSNTARGGGILAPIFRSLAGALGSNPDGEPRKAGSYLAFTGAMATVTTSAMFMTAMAANSIVTDKAAENNIEFGWGTWALAMIVPGLVALAVMPLLIYWLYPPEMKDASAAREKAKGALQDLGPWSLSEKVMAGVFVLLIALWSTGKLHGIPTVGTAWIGVLILIFSRTLSYKDILDGWQTWDALLWLGGLLSMANLLADYGLVKWFAQAMQGAVGGIDPVVAMIILACAYFYSMYAFSMLTAHISAMVGPFLAVLLAVEAPGIASVALLAAFSNVCACLTTYSTGPVIIYFGFGYVPAGRWFGLGAIVSIVHMAIWLGVGLGWWKLLGWW